MEDLKDFLKKVKEWRERKAGRNCQCSSYDAIVCYAYTSGTDTDESKACKCRCHV